MIYAVGDIHGQRAELDRVLRLIEDDGGPGAAIVFLGDYVDRGPDSRGVLARLIEGRAAGRNWTCLLGNHDRMFLRFLRDGEVTDPAIRSGATWFHQGLGGRETLASYLGPDNLPPLDALPTERPRPPHPGILDNLRQAARAAVPEDHFAFLETLLRYSRTEAQLFVHAGIRPGLPMDRQREDDLVWIRDPFLMDPMDHGALVVHGHTALHQPAHYGNRLNLDSGAGYGRPLTAAAIDGRRAWALTEAGRRPLHPEGWTEPQTPGT